MKEVVFTDAALRQWTKLSPVVRGQINRKLAVYAEGGAGDVKALQGAHGLRLRVGDWRVIFTLESGDRMLIHAIGNRREIYK